MIELSNINLFSVGYINARAYALFYSQTVHISFIIYCWNKHFDNCKS